jgi:trigger factor
MDWDTFLSMSGGESREAYDAEQKKNIEEAVRTQFVLDAIADAREITVDNDDLSAQIMAQASRNRMSPEQYAQQLQQSGNIAEFVADVRRTKALAQLLEQTTITDASGNVVDLESVRPQTVRAAGETAGETAEEAGTAAETEAPEDAAETEAPEGTVADDEAPDAEVANAFAVEAAEGAVEDSGDVTKG